MQEDSDWVRLSAEMTRIIPLPVNQILHLTDRQCKQVGCQSVGRGVPHVWKELEVKGGGGDDPSDDIQ